MAQAHRQRASAGTGGIVKTPCTCAAHRFGAPDVVDGHTYGCQDDWHPKLTDMQRWRWTCSCGRRGQWTIQSPNVPYHSWLVAHGWAHDAQ